jgi:hypothetical protein
MGIISIEIRRHRGQAVRLDDGTMITSGRLLIELHMNNEWFLRNRGTISNAGEIRWRVSSAFAKDLGYMAEQLAEGKFPPEVDALHGVTTLHLPAQRLGFTVTELPPGLRQRLVTFYLSGLRRAYYFGKGEEYTRKPPALKEVWMSKSRLLDRYGRRV